MYTFTDLLPQCKLQNVGKIAQFLLLVTVAVLTACSTVPVPAPIAAVEPLAMTWHLPQDIPPFAVDRPAIVGSDDIYRLSAAQREAFLAYYHDAANRDIPEHERVVEYLKAEASAFDYSHETRTANEVFQLSGGNCLSLANTTTALARLVKVRVAYQYMDDLPLFEKQENIILRGTHVRSVLYQPVAPVDDAGSDKKLIRPSLSRVIVDYFPTGRSRYVRRISEAEFTAMYYRNLAADALAEEDYSGAYWLVKESMIHAADHPHALNMLAILYRRSGDEQTAEQIYLYGIEKSDEKLSLLKNYRTLLNNQGRTTEADEITQRIAKYKDADPFEWWLLAEDAYQEENYSDALTYYKKSVEIAPYLHEGYFGMAKTYYQLGRLDSAEVAMVSAVENASRKQFRKLYEAKLLALSKHK
jgi:tetratricopeptide (TPR) repeat protein